MSEYQFDISYPDDGGGNGFEDEARLSALAPLRDDILGGDYRMLYLGWLLAASVYGFDEDLEPPIPPGLGKLSAPLTEFVRLFQLDPYVVLAAAQASAPLEPTPVHALAPLIPHLPRAECDDFLRRLVEGEPLLALKLTRRLQELAGPATEPQTTAPRRTWGELSAAARQLQYGEKRR